MSLILKGIDLPTKKQKTLIVEIAWDGDVWVDNHDRYELKYNSAKQIPKGHGRLIDGGWVKYNLENYSDLPTKYLHMDLVREAIEDAPTILDEERE